MGKLDHSTRNISILINKEVYILTIFIWKYGSNVDLSALLNGAYVDKHKSVEIGLSGP